MWCVFVDDDVICGCASFAARRRRRPSERNMRIARLLEGGIILRARFIARHISYNRDHSRSPPPLPPPRHRLLRHHAEMVLWTTNTFVGGVPPPYPGRSRSRSRASALDRDAAIDDERTQRNFLVVFSHQCCRPNAALVAILRRASAHTLFAPVEHDTSIPTRRRSRGIQSLR